MHYRHSFGIVKQGELGSWYSSFVFSSMIFFSLSLSCPLHIRILEVVGIFCVCSCVVVWCFLLFVFILLTCFNYVHFDLWPCVFYHVMENCKPPLL